MHPSEKTKKYTKSYSFTLHGTTKVPGTTVIINSYKILLKRVINKAVIVIDSAE